MGSLNVSILSTIYPVEDEEGKYLTDDFDLET